MSGVKPPKTLQIYDRSFALKKRGRIAILYTIQEWNRTRYGVYKFSEFPYVEYNGHVWTTRKVRSAYFFNKGVYETYQRALKKFDKLEQEQPNDTHKQEDSTEYQEVNQSKSDNIRIQEKTIDQKQTRKRRTRSENGSQLRLFQDDN
ncbi:MAG: hypothetical protein ACW99Q_14240 [Candidatus Kariarchaeaceae archaeon]|jgi:hypothetical protein